MSASSLTLTKLTLLSYTRALKQASFALMRSWILIPGCVALIIGWMLAQFLIGSLHLGMAGGFILGLLQAFFLSLLYQWLGEALRTKKLTHRSLAHFDSSLFFGIINVGFILFILDLVLEMLSAGRPAPFLSLGLGLGLLFFFNALPETIYLGRTEGTQAFSRAGTFIKENWIEWYIPFLILLLPFFLADGGWRSALVLIASAPPLLPIYFVVKPWVNTIFAMLGVSPTLGGSFILSILSLVLMVSVTLWIMLFRGALFLELDGTSRRSRLYKANLDSSR